MQTERYKQVESVLIKRGFGNLLGVASNKETHKQSPQDRLKIVLEELGGGFVLLGQLLKFRVDLIPTDYCKALARLRDKGTPIAYKEFEEELAKQYTRPLETIFSNIITKPLLVDVVSQTHEATLVNGDKVHVKIIKPKSKILIKEDITILKYLAKKIKLPLDTTYIIKELEDYVKNKSNLELEETFLSHSGKYASSYIPQVVSTISHKKVIVIRHLKKRPVEDMKKQMTKIQGDVNFIQGEFIISFIGLFFVAIGLFLPEPLNKVFLYFSIACFVLVFIFLAQHQK
ncbi:hypothetical protein K9M74_02795 [Candidatus Woesearchaeota archaeon]|nr:hypothetical protein [Candidatus Woesearchaeota archaeon]